MKHTTLLAYFGSIVLCAGVAALAPLGGGDFDLSWNTIDGGGGGSSTGGEYKLAGTVGQHDAGLLMTGGDFALLGGFWPGAGSSPQLPCTGDLGGDGAVNAADLAVLLGAWGLNPGHPADLNDDGDVNAADLAILLGAWGPC